MNCWTRQQALQIFDLNIRSTVNAVLTSHGEISCPTCTRPSCCDRHSLSALGRGTRHQGASRSASK